MLENILGSRPNRRAVGSAAHRSAESNLPLIINEESGRGKMHLVIIWVNTDSADLFIGDKKIAHMSGTDTQTNRGTHTDTHNCNVSNL